MALVTVSFSYKTTQGTAATGTVRFRAAGAKANTVQSVQLSNGTGSVQLTIIQPTVYVVTEQIDNVSRMTYQVTIPSSPSSVNLASLRPNT